MSSYPGSRIRRGSTSSPCRSCTSKGLKYLKNGAEWNCGAMRSYVDQYWSYSTCSYTLLWHKARKLQEMSWEGCCPSSTHERNDETTVVPTSGKSLHTIPLHSTQSFLQSPVGRWKNQGVFIGDAKILQKWLSLSPLLNQSRRKITPSHPATLKMGNPKSMIIQHHPTRDNHSFVNPSLHPFLWTELIYCTFACFAWLISGSGQASSSASQLHPLSVAQLLLPE